VGPIRDDDAVIFFNFRADRARQMTRAIAEPDLRNSPTQKGRKICVTSP